MPVFSKEEQELIDRLQASGRPVHGKQLDAPFKFMVRPLTTVGIPSLQLASWCEDAIFDAVSGIVFESPIAAIVISPKIFDRNVAEPPEDSLTYKENERSVFISRSIDFAAWDSASQKKKLHLIIENIKHSLAGIPNTYLLQSDSEKLLLAIDQVYPNLERRILH
jgi:hypothetical protein